ncbi:MAG: hypothetical protein JRE61_11700 [Deltaproteobacteria bacterium]|nr:hypothetical protein [Deltaproteobacteria bacterium]
MFDRKKVFIGSLNLDPRALVHNTEIGVVPESTKIATGMSDRFDQNIEQVAFRLELKKENEPKRSSDTDWLMENRRPLTLILTLVSGDVSVSVS